MDSEVRTVLAGAVPVLDPVSWDVLRRVRTKPSAVVSLAHYTCLSRSRVSEVVARLVGLGLVVQTDSDTDRRVRFARATDRGRALLAELEPTVSDLADLLLDDLGIGAQDALLQLVGVLAEGA